MALELGLVGPVALEDKALEDQALEDKALEEAHLVPLVAAAADGAVHNLAHIVLIDGRGVDADL